MLKLRIRVVLPTTSMKRRERWYVSWDKNTGKRIALCRALVSYYNDRDKVFMKVCNDLVSIKNYCLDQSIYAEHKADSYRDELNKHLG